MPTLKELRERAMFSQGEVAKALDVHRQTIHFWEHGLSLPRPVYQRRLVELYKCAPEELLAAIKDAREERKRREQEDEKEQPAA